MKKYKWMIPTVWDKRGKKLRFVDYRINKEGIVKRVRDGKNWKSKAGVVMKTRKDYYGYMVVNLCLGKRQYSSIKFHRLLWETFIGRIPKGYEINHNNKEGDKTKNDLKDLECVTHKENIHHAKEMGLNWTKIHRRKQSKRQKGIPLSEETCRRMSVARIGKKNPMYGMGGEKSPVVKLTQEQVNEIRTLSYTEGWMMKEIAKKFKVSNGCVNNIVQGYNWNPCGLTKEELKTIEFGEVL